MLITSSQSLLLSSCPEPPVGNHYLIYTLRAVQSQWRLVNSRESAECLQVYPIAPGRYLSHELVRDT